MDYLQLACVLVFTISLTIQQITGVPQSASACITETQKTLNFNCGYGYMLRITKTFYGYSSSKMCVYQPGDCIEEEVKAYPCTGKEACSINLPSGGKGREISSCLQNSNYFQVNYECIPAAESKDICNYTVLTAQKGYITTPGYPNNYRSNTQCTVRIQAEEYQTINLYILDMDLEKDKATHTCQDFVLAKDSTGSSTLCGRRWNEESLIKWKDLQIQFNSNDVNNNKGFWLYYEATPLRTTTTKKPTTPTPTVRTADQHITSRPVDTLKNTGGNVIPVTKTVNNINIDKKEKVPFAAIVGGVIGTLSLILIILLVLLIVKWAREKSRRRDKNLFIEVQNPGYRNSNEFQQNRPHLPRQDLCYNYMDV